MAAEKLIMTANTVSARKDKLDKVLAGHHLREFMILQLKQQQQKKGVRMLVGGTACPALKVIFILNPGHQFRSSRAF